MANNIRCELFNDHHQNYKRYHIPKAQLVIADIPYNLGNNAYASSPEWYVDGDNKNGESNKAGKAFFENAYKRAKKKRKVPLHDSILCIPANANGNRIRKEIWIQ